MQSKNDITSHIEITHISSIKNKSNSFGNKTDNRQEIHPTSYGKRSQTWATHWIFGF